MNFSSPSESCGPAAVGRRRRKSGQSPARFRPNCSSPPSAVRAAGIRSLKMPKTSQSIGTLASLHMFTSITLNESCRCLQESSVRCAVMSSSAKGPTTPPRLVTIGCPRIGWHAGLGRHRCCAITSLKTGDERPFVKPGKDNFHAVESLSS